MSGSVRKEYLCVVDGYPPSDIGSTFVVEAPIQRHPSIAFVREVGDSAVDSKPAQTTYAILDKSEEKRMSLLHVSPQSGRTHQIRIHCREYGLPIVGDDLYNEKENKMYESYEEISRAANDSALLQYGDNNPLRAGLKLHAWKIALQHPDTGETLHFCAPPPIHMRRILESSGMSVPQ